MTLAPGYLLACIVATHAGSLRCLDTLTVECSRRGMFVATRTLAHLSAKRIVDTLPGSIIAPFSEVSVHTLPRRVLPWQHAPLASRHHQIQDRIDDPAH